MPYGKMSDVSASLRGIKPTITLAQANSIARIADALEDKKNVDNPWAVAISRFKNSHIVRDDKWVLKEDSEFGMSVKAIEVSDVKYIILRTTNAFVDREEQIISTKALRDYVRRRDKSNLRDRVRFWHIRGSDYANIVWQDVVGRVLVEVAEVDDTEIGRKMYHALEHPDEYPDVLSHGWGTSHGFLYPASALNSGVYDVIEKYETTTLPRQWASNPFGGIMLSVKEVVMEMSDKKRDALVALLGEEKAKEIIDNASTFSKSLEDAGVTWKEFGDEDEEEEDEEEEEEDEEEEEEETTKGVDGDIEYELELDEKTLKDIASCIPIEAVVKSVMKDMLPDMLSAAVKPVVMDQVDIAFTNARKALVQSVTDTKEQIVAGALAGTLRLRPVVASKSKETEVDAEEVDIKNKGIESGGDPVANVVASMMRGD